MRLIDVNDAQKQTCGNEAGYLEQKYVRGRFPEARPSALRKRGEPGLSEIGTPAYSIPDNYRYCALCQSMGCEHAAVMRELARWESHVLHVDPVPGCCLCGKGIPPVPIFEYGDLAP